MGPSGSGKSTMMNLLGCLDKPDSGIYTFADEDVMTLDKDQLAHFTQHLYRFCISEL